MSSVNRELQFMLEAIELSRKGISENQGGPFGCVVVRGDEIIGRGWNKVTSTNDPTAHAEVVAIRDACSRLNHFQLLDCEIYTSCEPCPMCMGAIYWARPRKVFFGNSREDAAAIGFDDSLIYTEVSSPTHMRQIPMSCLAADHAIKVFQEWKNKPGKIAY